jgi:hypothetical protein
MNPHASQIVAQKVVERVSRKEGQAVGNPIGLIRIVIEVGLGSLAQVANGLGSLLVGSRPNTKADTVQSVGRVLLKHKGMVDAMRLAPASANLNIVGEASLRSRVR